MTALAITAITDFLLASEAFFLAGRLSSTPKDRFSAAWYFSGVLLLLGVAALLGGIDHGFFQPANLPRYVSGRRWRIRLPSRWPPSAAQTWCAVFPRHAFTKTQTTRYDAGPTEWGRLRTCQVDQVHQSPRTMMYGFFPKELIHLIALTRLTSLLFLPAFVCRLPRPTPVADRSVTRLSPCLKYYSAVRLLTEHRSPLRFRL
jgi:hypothetical protein